MFILLDESEKEFVTVSECSKRYPNCKFILLNPQGEGQDLKGELYCVADTQAQKLILDTLDCLDKEGKYFSLYDSSKSQPIC